MNNVVLVGRLTKDPELRFIPGNGRAVANFSLAVNRPFKNSQGEQEADFLNIVVWGRQAENCANYLSKGRLASVSGRIQVRSYENNQGERRYVTEIVADQVEFLEWGDNKQNNTDKGRTQENSGDGDGFQPVDNEDIPF